MEGTATNKQQCPAPQPAPEKYPIINCHTHIFTGDHVPPYLAKSIVNWPFYCFVNFRWIFKKFRRYYTKRDRDTFDGSANLKARTKYEKEKKFRQQKILYTIYLVAGFYLTLQSIDILLHWAFTAPEHPNLFIRILISIHHFLTRFYVLLDLKSVWWQAGVVILVVLFYKAGRNLLWALAGMLFSVIRKLPGKKTRELFERYLTIGRYAFHKTQQGTLTNLKNQYPDNTGFVILPMDMIYMDAGAPAVPYKEQMEELARLKAGDDTLYPFVFADPRRMQEDPSYFKYTVSGGRVVLDQDCFMKKYLEGHEVEKGDRKVMVKFCGLKIYPALGYYPFDPLLLPLWKYAQQENLPVMTHCVRGPMYFRGKKKTAWDKHPVFKELTRPLEPKNRPDTPADYTDLLLADKKNDVFSANFTHPMNFLCLLKKEFLAPAVQIAWDNAPDQQTKDNLVALFGFTPASAGNDPVVTSGLDDLKICFGHYGGGDEWYRYFESDRFRHSTQVISRPDFGIDFLYTLDRGQSTTDRSWGKPEQLWKYTDWYSIISSIMLQHKNVYADISYILHADAEILPLLKETLLNKKLRSQVLYGTDFFVVRNHKSDKNMLADMMGGLSEQDFDQIARCNPRKFLDLPMYLQNPALPGPQV